MICAPLLGSEFPRKRRGAEIRLFLGRTRYTADWVCNVGVLFASLVGFSRLPKSRSSQKGILHQWASYIKAEIGRIPNAESSSYDWALSCVPSAYAIRTLLSKTRRLLDQWAGRLSVSLALLGGNVIRTDGHFKAARRIMGAGPNQCMIAYLGCGVFLLNEVDLVPSESCDS